MSVLSSVKAFFKTIIETLDPELHRQREAEAFLAEATDHADLEWRIKSLDRRRPSNPFQQY
jgi:hypothetical protein